MLLFSKGADFMVNYPNKKESFKKQKTNHSNRGMSFENIINETNDYYLAHNIAIIIKNQFQFKLLKLIIHQEQELLSKKHITKFHQQLIIMEYIKVNILILRQKKQLAKPLFQFQISIFIKLNIYQI